MSIASTAVESFAAPASRPPSRVHLPSAAQADLEATNALQNTEWAINQDILDAAIVAFDSGHPCLCVDTFNRPELLPKLPPEEFAALWPDERWRLTAARNKRARDRLEWAAGVCGVQDLIGIASESCEHPALHVAWRHDDCLRRHAAITAGPSPQADDSLSRALLSFAQGVPLGSTGLHWLAVQLATAAGQHGTPAARAAWTMAHMEEVRASALDPLNVSWWWQPAAHEDHAGERRADPWGVLAAARELDPALSLDSPAAYLSHLPVHLAPAATHTDHLAAMVLRPGAGGPALPCHPDALDPKVAAARAAARWLQVASGLLQQAGEPFPVTTPAGSIITLASTTAAARDVAACFLAAHEARTVNAGGVLGITDWAGTGARFGTHAGSMEALTEAHQREFAAIHADAWMDRLWLGATAAAPSAGIPRPPARSTSNAAHGE